MTHIIIHKKKGNIPLKIVSIETSLTTLLIAKTLTPTGGVICPISIKITITTPNQMGSKPKACIDGKIAGNVSIIMRITFIKAPRIIYRMQTAANIKYLFTDNPDTNFANPAGS